MRPDMCMTASGWDAGTHPWRSRRADPAVGLAGFRSGRAGVSLPGVCCVGGDRATGPPFGEWWWVVLRGFAPAAPGSLSPECVVWVVIGPQALLLVSGGGGPAGFRPRRAGVSLPGVWFVGGAR